MIKEVDGDIFDYFERGDIQVLVHQANCHHIMGAGIALKIKQRYSEAYDADCKTTKGDILKMGTYSRAVIKGKVIVNLYSQFGIGSSKDGGRDTQYDAMHDGLWKLREKMGAKPYAIGVPYKIGCRLGGGAWRIVKAILFELFESSHHILYIVKLPGDE